MDGLCRNPFFLWMVVSAGSKRSRTVLAGAKYEGQSLQEAKISGFVYTLCSMAGTPWSHENMYETGVVRANEY